MGEDYPIPEWFLDPMMIRLWALADSVGLHRRALRMVMGRHFRKLAPRNEGRETALRQTTVDGFGGRGRAKRRTKNEPHCCSVII